MDFFSLPLFFGAIIVKYPLRALAQIKLLLKCESDSLTIKKPPVHLQATLDSVALVIIFLYSPIVTLSLKTVSICDKILSSFILKWTPSFSIIWID